MKKIPWWKPQIGIYEKSLINKVLKQHFPNEGKMTEEFESKLADLLKVKHVVTVTSCTAAIFLSLKAFRIGFGDEVIVPDMTFIATANAVEMTGAKALLVDIDPRTLTIDLYQLEKSITKKTKAIIPVHVSGRAADMTEIIKIAKRNNISVIEDAAEAFMSLYKGKYLGTFGRIGCFSLSAAKTITTGQGGFIATNDNTIYQTLKELKDQGRFHRGTGGDDTHNTLGYNFKFTNLQAAVGLGQLKYLKQRMKRMKRNYLLYRKYLKDVKEISFFDTNIESGELPQWTDITLEKRNDLDSFLSKHNIECRRYWFPLHTQAYYKKSDAKFPKSSQISPKALWLPSAFTLTDQDIKTVCNYIKTFFKKQKKQ